MLPTSQLELLAFLKLRDQDNLILYIDFFKGTLSTLEWAEKSRNVTSDNVWQGEENTRLNYLKGSLKTDLLLY